MSFADEHGSICIDIKFHSTDSNYKWQLGLCHNSIAWHVRLGGIYIQKCCLANGDHVLSCMADDGEDWNKGSVIRIGAHQFCDDFAGYPKLTRINIPGMVNIFTYMHVPNNHDASNISNILYFSLQLYQNQQMLLLRQMVIFLL